LQKGEKLCQAAHTADTIAENECSSLVALDEVIEIKVLLLKGTNNASFCQSASYPCGSEEKFELSSKSWDMNRTILCSSSPCHMKWEYIEILRIMHFLHEEADKIMVLSLVLAC
jgi:hypothetical protein